MLDRKDVFSTLIDNWKKTTNPVGLKSSELTAWSEGLNLPTDTGTIIYTGGLYQMVPFINAFVAGLDRLESSSVGGAGFKVFRALSSIGLDVSSAYAALTAGDKKRFGQIIVNVVSLLKKSGVEVSYLGADELYSGVLFHDMGIDWIFEEQAKAVYGCFKKHGVKKVITMDPHSTVALKMLYPEVIEGYDLDVKHYLEVLDPSLSVAKDSLKGQKFTIHDPCLLARRLGLWKNSRALLAQAGAEIAEPVRTRNFTFCCGGPIENIAPKVSNEITIKRAAELKKAADKAVLACPICLANFTRVEAKTGLQAVDLLEVIR
ncbi:MAG TPA: (Fe-S)-binding protein [Conexivisphaerales archaeon]|nr:(Fe-S)-binding protein [Conexivisphaerales archaeon]